LEESSILTVLSVLYSNNNSLQPVKCKTDKAYGWTKYLWPLHTILELRLMAPADKLAAEKEDA